MVVKVKKQERNSNFELMRIISMIFIILWHIIIHGNLINNLSSNPEIQIFFDVLSFIIMIHVNSFILVTGYFQYDKEFKLSKLISISNLQIFYMYFIFIILCLLGINFEKTDLINRIFITFFNQYWFIATYLLLYVISPFLNILIKHINKKTYFHMLLVLLFIFSIIPYLTGNQVFQNNGYTLYNFVFLYFIGAYLGKYNIKNSYYFKNMTTNLYRLLLIFTFFICVILNYGITTISIYFCNSSENLRIFFQNFIAMKYAYSNPIVIIQSIVFFLFFETLNFKSIKINKIAGLTLGIYAIHDNYFVRQHLYRVLKIDYLSHIWHYKFIIYVFLCVILIFIVGAIIEYIRQKVFKFIYNRKISGKIRNKFYNFIGSIKINN